MPKTATVDDLPLLERRRIEAMVLVPVIRAMQARFGTDEVNDVVGEAIRNLAREQGAAVRAATPPVESADELRERFTGGGPIMEGSLEVELTEATPAEFGFDVRHCAFVDMYNELGAGDLGFLLSCNRDAATFAGMAPQLDFERTQTRMQGASHCDFRFRERP